jgi:hypothetical protein
MKDMEIVELTNRIKASKRKNALYNLLAMATTAKTHEEILATSWKASKKRTC